MTWDSASRSRRNNFDVIRLFFAVMVIYSHSYPYSRGFAHADDGIAVLTHGQVNGGALAVDGFFVISGFLIAQSWISSTRGVKVFFSKRARRIVPGFVMAMGVTAVILAPLGSTPWYAAVSARQLTKVALRTALLAKYPALKETFATNPVPNEANGSMWTIQYEWWCYVLIAILGLVHVLKNRTVLLAGFVLVLIICCLQDWKIIPELYWPNNKFGHLFSRFAGLALDQWPRLLSFFLSGSLFFVFRSQMSDRWPLALAAVVSIALCSRLGGLDAAMPIAGTYLILYIAFHPKIPFNNFGRFGDFSYGTYLYSSPIQQLIVEQVHPTQPLTLFVMATPASVLAGLLSWHLVERRFTHGRRQGPNSPVYPSGDAPTPAVTTPSGQ